MRARIEQVRPLFGGVAIPFYQLPRLGGQRSLRGFVSDRFQDDGSLLLTAEYRYPIWTSRYPGWTGIDATFFVDTGQVFNALGEVAVNDFKVSVGGGLHLLNCRGLSARFEVARSMEGVTPNVTGVSRGSGPASGWAYDAQGSSSQISRPRFRKDLQKQEVMKGRLSTGRILPRQHGAPVRMEPDNSRRIA